MMIAPRFFLAMLTALLLPLLVSGSPAAAPLLPDNLPISDAFSPGYGSPIGRVLMVQGRAVVIHGDQQQGYWIKPEMLLYKDDTLVTMEGSRLRYAMNDGSVMTMAAATRLVLSEAVLDPQTRSSFIKMDEGRARFFVKKLGKLKKSNFKVKTPTALVGVRGSDFVLAASAMNTQVTTLDDTVLEVVSLAYLDRPPTVLRSYERTSVELGKLPTEVERVSPAEIDKLESEFGGAEDAAAGPDVTEGIEVEEPEILVPEEVLVAPERRDGLPPTTVRDIADRAVEIATDADAGRGAITGDRSFTRQDSSVVLDGGTDRGSTIDVFGQRIEDDLTGATTELPDFPGPPR